MKCRSMRFYASIYNRNQIKGYLPVHTLPRRTGRSFRAATKDIDSRNLDIRSSSFLHSSCLFWTESSSITSILRLSPHEEWLFSMLLQISCKGGKIFTKVLMSGATANSMKPICMLQRATELRSHMGEISRPISLSVSPCWKNSSTTRSAHLAQSS